MSLPRIYAIEHTHADQRPPVMQCNTIALQAVSTSPHHLGNPLVKGVCKGNVGNHSLLEKCPWTESLGAINDLIRNHKIAGLDFLPQATDGREGDDGTDTDGTQGSDIGAGGNLMGCQLVVQTVTTQKCDCDSLAGALALVVKDGDRRRGVTPRRRDIQRRNLGEARKLSKTSAANYADSDGIYSA